MVVTHDTLPDALHLLLQQVARIESKLGDQPKDQQVPQDNYLTVPQAAAFLHLAIPTIYGLIHKRDIPVLKKNNRCYFLQADLVAYLESGRQKTINELKEEVDKAPPRRGRRPQSVGSR